MAESYASVEERVLYGLDSIDPERKVEISLRDLMFIYKTLGEFISFFHHPLHYPDVDAVEKFLGTMDSGAFHLVRECYHQKLYDVWPEDVQQQWDEGELDHPEMPYYY